MLANLESPQEQMALDEPQASQGCWQCSHSCSATTSFFFFLKEHPWAHQCPPGHLLTARSCSLQWLHMYFLRSLTSSHKMENSLHQSWKGCQETNGCCCLDVSAAVSTGPWGVWIPEHCYRAVRTLSNCHCCGKLPLDHWAVLSPSQELSGCCRKLLLTA